MAQGSMQPGARDGLAGRTRMPSPKSPNGGLEQMHNTLAPGTGYPPMAHTGQKNTPTDPMTRKTPTGGSPKGTPAGTPGGRVAPGQAGLTIGRGNGTQRKPIGAPNINFAPIRTHGDGGTSKRNAILRGKRR